MSELYEKCVKVRNGYEPGTKCYEHANQVLLKLLGIAFQNEDHPDKLPKRFCLYHVKMGADHLEAIFDKLGIKVNIELVDQNKTFGQIYWITILDK